MAFLVIVSFSVLEVFLYCVFFEQALTFIIIGVWDHTLLDDTPLNYRITRPEGQNFPKEYELEMNKKEGSLENSVCGQENGF